MVSPLLKEWCVMIPLMMHQFTCGIMLAFPAVLTPAITSSETTGGIQATREQASWIVASFALTGGVGFLLLPALMQLYGRKFIKVTINLILIAGWLTTAFSTNVAGLVAGRAIHGLAFGSLHICGIIASEYSHPKRRGFFVVAKQSATGVGELVCHGLGFMISWRQLAWLGIIPAVVAILATYFWTESPSWLAFKERYEECAKTFEWLRGVNADSNMELKKLISAQQEMKRIKKLKEHSSCRRFWISLRSKELMRPFSVLLVAVVLAHICGRHFLQTEIIQIMVSLTGNPSKAFYYTVVFDCMKIVALWVSCYVVRKFKRRTLFFSAGYFACFLLGLFCVSDLLVSNQWLDLKWLTPLLLISFNIVIYIGVIPLTMVLKGELFPLEYKGMGTSMVGISSSICSAILLKSTSRLLDILEPHGTFAIYLLIAMCCLTCLQYILPETKDRTLQDIELEFTNFKLINGTDGEELTDKLMNNVSK